MKLILLFVLLVACKALSIKSSVEKSRFRCSLMRLPNRHRMYVDSGTKGDGGLDTTRDRDSYREVDFPLPLSDMSNGLLTMNVLGQIDFCLRTVDNSPLSGPSRSKLMNTITNNVFKAVVIGNDPIANDVLSQFAEFREQLVKMPVSSSSSSSISSVMSSSSSNGSGSGDDEDESFTIISPSTDIKATNRDRVNTSGVTVQGTVCFEEGCQPEKAGEQAESESEDTARVCATYLEWLEQLLRDGTVASDSVLQEVVGKGGNLYDRGYRRLLTMLRDTGCSFQDQKKGEGDNGGRLRDNFRPTPPETSICLSLMDLNQKDSKDSKDNQIRARSLTITKELNYISNTVSRAMLYGGSEQKEMLAADIEMNIFNVLGNFNVPLYENQLFVASSDTNSNLKECQEATYMRALAFLLRFGLVAAQEQISGAITNTGLFGESKIEGRIGAITIEVPPLRLYDAYTNAFQRVIEVCLSEISNRNVPQNEEDVLLNFVQWEQILRQNLTADIWAPNPTELAGDWELIDIAGGGSLKNLMVNDADMYFGMRKGITVQLKKDGIVYVDSVTATATPTGSASRWFFKPGPAHLDTCEFNIGFKSNPDLVLRYTGFIDRGQRIESRFSNNPIRMTGRVMSIVKGEPQGSCRFIMAKRRSL